jgi:hypothetical protein
MPEPAPPCRRFQFRLRTLLIAVTLFCVMGGYLAREAKIVQERRAEWKSVKGHVSFRNEDDFGVLNWTRRALGDRPVYIIELPEETEPAEIARLRAIFPEGRIRLFDPKEATPAPSLCFPATATTPLFTHYR